LKNVELRGARHGCSNKTRKRLIHALRAASWKTGAGVFDRLIVPSIDRMIYKMDGNNGHASPTLADVVQPEPNHERDDGKWVEGTPFQKTSRAGNDGIRRVFEMVCAAV
jgi:hypothetical protein